MGHVLLSHLGTGLQEVFPGPLGFGLAELESGPIHQASPPPARAKTHLTSQVESPGERWGSSVFNGSGGKRQPAQDDHWGPPSPPTGRSATFYRSWLRRCLSFGMGFHPDFTRRFRMLHGGPGSFGLRGR